MATDTGPSFWVILKIPKDQEVSSEGHTGGVEIIKSLVRALQVVSETIETDNKEKVMHLTTWPGH